jgi:hypothetical protein
MRSLETITTPILLLPGDYISAFWDHNLEITIGFQGLGLEAQGMRWGWEQGLRKVPPPSPTPGIRDPVCPGLILQPITLPLTLCTHACTFIFPLTPFRGSGGGLQLLPCVAGSFVCVPGPFHGLS